MKYLLLTFLILTLLTSCSRDNRPFPARMLVGLNDTAEYHLNPKTGKAGAVIKLKYYKSGEYSVFLYRDTVELGEEFGSHFNVNKDDYQIIISEPTNQILTKEDFEPTKTLEYRFKTTEKGLFDFKGEIRYDTIVQPFEWKFIVI